MCRGRKKLIIFVSGRRNPLRMLSNAIDFRTRRKQRPKSADFESVDEIDGPAADTASAAGDTLRSASVHNILQTVTASSTVKGRPPLRALEARNSAPDILPGKDGKDRVVGRPRTRIGVAAAAKQKLSTRFQPQRKPVHRSLQPNTVKRAKTFSLGNHPSAGPGNHSIPPGYKTLPKQASSRSLGSSSSTDSGQGAGSTSNDSGQGAGSSCSQGSHSSTSSRKSSNSSCLSDSCEPVPEVSQQARDEIANFEKFIQEYFDNVENNNAVTKHKVVQVPLYGGGGVKGGGVRGKARMSTCSTLSEVLELSI